jgi:hypothetical protein
LADAYLTVADASVVRDVRSASRPRRHVEDAVWDAISEVLEQPERLLALAEEYLGTRGCQIETESEQMEVVVPRSPTTSARYLTC